MKGIFLWWGISLTILSWALNYGYFQSKQLEQPIFLDHYYEDFLNNEDERPLTFYYLTNKKNPVEVVSIAIDGIEGASVYNDGQGSFLWGKSGSRFEQEFRHHYLKSVTVQFRKETNLLSEFDTAFGFESMEVYFNNQSSIIADIGKVNFYLDDVPSKVFDSRMSSASNQHHSEEAMIAIEPLSVERISIPFSKDLAGEVAVKIDLEQGRLKELEALDSGGDFPAWLEEERDREWEEASGISIEEDLFPFKLAENEWLSLKMFFNPVRNTYFEFNLDIEGTTEAGESFVHHSPIIDHPYLDQHAIDQIIAEKAGEM